MREQKLASALAFLSMDCLSEFESKLQLTPTLKTWRLHELRKEIAIPIHSNQFQTRYPEICSAIYHSVKANKAEVWAEIWNWADSIYLFGGDDRSPERIWALILANLLAEGSQYSDTLNGLSSRLDSIQRKVIEAAKENALVFSSLVSIPFSEWDAAILPQIYLAPEDLTEKLDLMIRYNEMINAWRDNVFEMQDLCQIFELGKKSALKFGLREIDVPFPGCWEYSVSART